MQPPLLPQLQPLSSEAAFLARLLDLRDQAFLRQAHAIAERDPEPWLLLIYPPTDPTSEQNDQLRDYYAKRPLGRPLPPSPEDLLAAFHLFAFCCQHLGRLDPATPWAPYACLQGTGEFVWAGEWGLVDLQFTLRRNHFVFTYDLPPWVDPPNGGNRYDVEPLREKIEGGWPCDRDQLRQALQETHDIALGWNLQPPPKTPPR